MTYNLKPSEVYLRGESATRNALVACHRPVIGFRPVQEGDTYLNPHSLLPITFTQALARSYQYFFVRYILGPQTGFDPLGWE